MLKNRVVFLIFLATNVVSLENDRCEPDEECKNIKNCEEMKFFLSRNVEEIRKLKICGVGAETVR